MKKIKKTWGVWHTSADGLAHWLLMVHPNRAFVQRFATRGEALAKARWFRARFPASRYVTRRLPACPSTRRSDGKRHTFAGGWQ